MKIATIPAGRRLRVVGDVHADARAFAHALATDRFVIQLGDLVDHGPDGAEALRLALEMLRTGRGVFLAGNHEFRLARALEGQPVRREKALTDTLAALDPDLAAGALRAIRAAPLWLVQGRRVFVHGAFHPAMLSAPATVLPERRADGPAAHALFGVSTGRMLPDGYPERTLSWIHRIPDGWEVYCGHDRRSTDGRPARMTGAAGGVAVFLDTGAGKGGHLAWIDLDDAA